MARPAPGHVLRHRHRPGRRDPRKSHGGRHRLATTPPFATTPHLRRGRCVRRPRSGRRARTSRRKASVRRREFGHRPPRAGFVRTGDQPRVIDPGDYGEFGLDFGGGTSHILQISGRSTDVGMWRRVGMFAFIRRIDRKSPPDRTCKFTEPPIRPRGEPDDVLSEPVDLRERTGKGTHFGECRSGLLDRLGVDPAGWKKGYTTVTCAGTPQAAEWSSRRRWRPTTGSAQGDFKVGVGSPGCYVV